jgi:putative hydrolase of the HAD superfamily
MDVSTMRPRPRYRTVVFDLFGTLVKAPAATDRRAAAVEIAAVLGVRGNAVEAVLVESWAERHGGRLPTLGSLAAYLACRCGRPEAASQLSPLLLDWAAGRLRADAGVLGTLHRLGTRDLRIGVLSDASADIAEAWTGFPLARLVDAAVFSCRAGAVKPDPSLYSRLITQLRVQPAQALYCGDGGGDELRGATAAGLHAVQVERRGGPGALAFGERTWAGPSITRVEDIVALVLSEEVAS